MNVKVFNLTSGKCKCKFNEILYNSKQKLNHDKCRCECKELDDWSSYRWLYYMWLYVYMIMMIICGILIPVILSVKSF